MNSKRVGLGLLAGAVAALAAKRLRSKSTESSGAGPVQDTVTNRANSVQDEISTSLSFEAGSSGAGSETADVVADGSVTIPPLVSLPTAEMPEIPSDKTPKQARIPETASTTSAPSSTPTAKATELQTSAAVTTPAASSSSDDLLTITIPTMGDGVVEAPKATTPELPEIALPNVELPEIALNTARTGSTVRQADGSKITLPDFIVPEAETPSTTPLAAPLSSSPDGGTPPTNADVAGTRASKDKKRSRWGIAGSVLIGLFVLAGIAGSFIHLPYYRFDPGQVYDTVDRVTAPDDLIFEPEEGNIGFVTVAQTANITAWQWLDAKLDGGVRLEHRDLVEGDQTTEEVREEDRRRMQVSKNAAVVVALNELGYELVVTPIGIEVAEIFPCTAADGTLGTGDLIVGINGDDVRESEQFIAALADIGIGQEVDLLVERIDPNNPTQSIATETVNLTLGSADDSCLGDEVRADEPRPFIGIQIFPIFDEELPIEVDIDTGRVGGPSAGLAFTLAVLDVMSDGELTNGLNVVVTGTIQRDGRVGPVGGIHQKTIAAERSGADVFIVPMCCDNFVDPETGEPVDVPTNYEEALMYTDDMMIIGVETLDDAIEALIELGGELQLVES